ncbi:MAG: 1-(5-phosphoribosyl)-5-[(5-phosphoribosylamino) methylideneamino]imidazole-4-carboxamide isomerase [Steroidobacteraceae bacterium]
MRLIPAIDLRDGRCVRLLRGDFDAETRYDFEPRELLVRYRAAGADWMHVVDLDGARSGRPENREIILGLAREPGMRLQVGGGLRDPDAVRRILATGAARAVVGSAAARLGAVSDWFDQFGAARLVLAFDVRIDAAGVPRLALHGWQENSPVSLWEAVAYYAEHGLVHVLCTDVNRDGAMSGPNVSLYAEAIRRFPDIEWQASGGIRKAADVQALAAIGVSAAISGRALLEDCMSLEELRPFLQNASSPA